MKMPRYFPEEKAYQIALGNIDIHTHKFIADFDPDSFVVSYSLYFRKGVSVFQGSHPSIFDP